MTETPPPPPTSLSGKPAVPGFDPPPRPRRRPVSRRRRLFALGLLVAYLLVVMFGGVVDRLVLFPETDPMLTPGAARVEVPVPGRPPVDAYVLPPRAAAVPTTPTATAATAAAAASPEARPAGTPDPAAFLLAFNGNADRAEYMVFTAEPLAGRRAVEVWAMNYPGFGGSPGPARLAGIPPAALAAYDSVAAKAAGRPIVLYGDSLGTAAALHVAAHRPVAGLVLKNPPPLRQLILRKHGWWNAWLLAGPGSLAVPAELGSVANAAAVRCPAVFLSADEDEVVPPAFHRMVIDAYAGPKRVVHLPEARHSDPPSGPAAAEVREAVEALWETIGVPGPATRPGVPAGTRPPE